MASLYLALDVLYFKHLMSLHCVIVIFPVTYMVLSQCQNKDMKLLSYYNTFHVCYNRWPQETLHFHTKKDEEHEEFCNSFETITYESDRKTFLRDSEETCPSSQQSLLKNWPLMSSIIVYCVFQLHDMAYSEVTKLSFI